MEECQAAWERWAQNHRKTDRAADPHSPPLALFLSPSLSTTNLLAVWPLKDGTQNTAVLRWQRLIAMVAHLKVKLSPEGRPRVDFKESFGKLLPQGRF